MERELIWKGILEFLHFGSLYQDNIPLSLLKESAQNKFEPAYLKEYTDILIKKGENEMEVPFPTGDLERSGSWIWGNYSNQQMLKRVQYVFGESLNEYIRFVDIFFPKMKEELYTYAMMPVKVIGELRYEEENRNKDIGAPSLSWYYLPLERTKKNEINISYSNTVDFNHHTPTQSEITQRLNDWRKNNIDFVHASFASGYCFESSATPVTDRVYKIVKEDLKRIGWVK